MRYTVGCWMAIPLLTLLGGCVTRTAQDTLESITPGVSARIPNGLTRVPDYRGIDSDVARFEGKHGAVSFDRGMYGGTIPPEIGVSASTVIATGQRLDRSAITSGGEYPYGLILLEHVATDPPVVGEPYVPPVYLSISVLCHAAARCKAIADTIQSSLSIGERFPSDL